jgi:phosphotransferase system enzyme I (PtsI)
VPTGKRPGAKPRRDAPATGKETVSIGLGVSPGIAIGPAFDHDIRTIAEREYSLAANEVEKERERFRGALDKALRQLSKLKAKSAGLPPSAAEEIGYLLDAHAQMLSNSRLVRGVGRRIGEDRINAEAAVQAEVAAIAHDFQSMHEPYLAARVQDVREVGTRLLRNLTKTPFQAFKQLREGAIIISEEITPADTAQMDPEQVAGFAAASGGAESHTAIMARSLGLPAVLGADGLISTVRNGDVVVVDGDAGKVVVPPSPATLDDYER